MQVDTQFPIPVQELRAIWLEMVFQSGAMVVASILMKRMPFLVLLISLLSHLGCGKREEYVVSDGPVAASGTDSKAAKLGIELVEFGSFVLDLDDAIAALDGLPTSRDSLSGIRTIGLGLEFAVPPGGGGVVASGSADCSRFQALIGGLLKDATRLGQSLPSTIKCSLAVQIEEKIYGVEIEVAVGVSESAGDPTGALRVSFDTALEDLPSEARHAYLAEVFRSASAGGYVCGLSEDRVACSRTVVPFCAEGPANITACPALFVGKKVDVAKLAPVKGIGEMTQEDARSFVQTIRTLAEGTVDLLGDDGEWVSRVSRVVEDIPDQEQDRNSASFPVHREEIQWVSYRFDRFDDLGEPQRVIRLTLQQNRLIRRKSDRSLEEVVQERAMFEGTSVGDCPVANLEGTTISRGRPIERWILEYGPGLPFIRSQSTGCQAIQIDPEVSVGTVQLSLSEAIARDFPAATDPADATPRIISERVTRAWYLNDKVPPTFEGPCSGNADGSRQVRSTFADGHTEERLQRFVKQEGLCNLGVEVRDPKSPTRKLGSIVPDPVSPRAAGSIGSLEIKLDRESESVQSVVFSGHPGATTMKGSLKLEKQPDEKALRGSGQSTWTLSNGMESVIDLTIGAEGVREASSSVTSGRGERYILLQVRGRKGFRTVLKEVDTQVVLSSPTDAAAPPESAASDPPRTELTVGLSRAVDPNVACEIVGEGEYVDYFTDRSLTARVYEDGGRILFDPGTQDAVESLTGAAGCAEEASRSIGSR